ncbi:MAG: AarF/ABC1/UbiB kinase family protein [Acinetobacter sp.]|nr:AarF/ABC1/UbiB kinase family protein [Acinetobacter sp.]
MTERIANNKMKNLKTSATDRRLSIAKASLLAGTRWATASASSFFASPAEKERLRKQALQEQAQYLVSEIGKLKGSIVKIGQMMALYGEHFLPEEVTQALSTLNNQTTALEWSAIQRQLRLQLGSKLDDLIVDEEPLGTASLAQVHRAVRKSDGLEVVLKVQYPLVATAIDSDMNLFKQMLTLTRLTPQTREFDQWFEEVRQMMHREVNYQLEAETTKRFAERLKHDNRYIVPQIIDDYSTKQVLCMTYEAGIPIYSPHIMQLSQARRNAIGEAALEIIIRELFEWGEMQTDPNFGNYLLRIAEDEQQPDQIILLDFGAIRQFDTHLLKVAQGLIHAGYQQNHQAMMNAMTGYRYFDTLPPSAKSDMAHVFLLATEALHSDDAYDWKARQLHERIMQKTSTSVASRHFTVPPKEFMFISRKFIGAYTFMTVIEAQTQVKTMITPHLPQP